MKHLQRGVVTVLCVLFIAQTSWCFENEPDRFRGIQWGTDIADVQKMLLVADFGNYKYYRRENDPMKMGTAGLAGVWYGFYKGKFASVLIGIGPEDQFDALKKIFFEHYGDGYGPEGTMREEYYWFGIDVTISMCCNRGTQRGTITYIYRPIEREREDEIRAGVGESM